jgi:hypothetical protein
MNGLVWSKEAKAVKETGDVWGVRIPYPSAEVLADMGWSAVDKDGNHIAKPTSSGDSSMRTSLSISI